MSAILKTKNRLKPRRNGAARISDIIINGDTHIPTWVVNHETFRRWACSDEFPSRGQFFYIDGQFWVDLSMETLIHNQIKGIINIIVGAIVLQESLGRYLGDRMMLTNVAAALSCEPDGMYISNDTLERGLVTFVDDDQSLEVSGTPDMTLEVISKKTRKKDTIDLMTKYADAGITEYWLVDSTIENPELIIYRLVGGKYVAVRRHDGWVKSKVFGRSFRLASKKDAKGMSQFNLEVK